MKQRLLSLVLLGLTVGTMTACHFSHDWQAADCVTPKTCLTCGKTEGEALGHVWQEATCTAPKTCSVCGETAGEPLIHEWLEATYTDPKTCSLCGLTEGEALPKPYCEENNITFEKLQDMDLPFAAGFSENGEIVDIDGLWVDSGMAHYAFGEITSEPSEKEGYVNVTIPYTVTLSPAIHLDETKFTGNFRIEASWQSFNIGDSYTGLLVPSKDVTYGTETNEYTKDFEWEGNTYTISYIKDTNSKGNFSGWTSEGGSIHTETYNVVADVVYTITIPEDYDGAVLAINRNGSEEVKLKNEETDQKDTYFLDEHDADYFIFYRLSDLIS